MNQTSGNIVLLAFGFFLSFILIGNADAFANDASVNNVIWQTQNSGVAFSLHSVYAVSNDVAWVVGEGGVILKTTDGGANWQQQSSGTNKELWSVYFINDTTGWIAGYEGTILKTTDGGDNWVPKNSSTVFHLISLHFVDLNTGWVVGSGGTILKTTNGGNNWQLQFSGTSEPIISVDFADILNGWATGTNAGTIFKTTDGGSTWQAVSVPTIWFLSSIDFINRDIGWGVGFVGIIFKSTDGGNTWVEKPGVIPNPDILYSVSFPDVMNGYAVGNDGFIINTTDGGETWIRQYGGTVYLLWSVYFVTSDIGWAVGDYGTILKASSPSAIEIDPQSISGDFILYDNYPNPFNPATTISYSIPKTLRVTLRVYSVSGEEIRTVVNEAESPGRHSIVWDGRNDEGRMVSSGVYIYQLIADGAVRTKKMIFLK